jgi:hypothetical protein
MAERVEKIGDTWFIDQMYAEGKDAIAAVLP